MGKAISFSSVQLFELRDDSYNKKKIHCAGGAYELSVYIIRVQLFS